MPLEIAIPFQYRSRKDERNSDAAHDIDEPHRERDANGTADGELTSIRRGKPNADKNENPENKDIDVFAQRQQPLGSSMRHKRGEVRGNGIFNVQRAGRL